MLSSSKSTPDRNSFNFEYLRTTIELARFRIFSKSLKLEVEYSNAGNFSINELCFYKVCSIGKDVTLDIDDRFFFKSGDNTPGEDPT